MKRVVLESPFAGDVNLHLDYARACMADSLKRGEAPAASHLLYTQPGILDDTIPEERTLGMEAGFAWGALAEAAVVYCDLGMSSGMVEGVARANAQNTPVEHRHIGFSWAADRDAHVEIETWYRVERLDDQELSEAVQSAQSAITGRWAELESEANGGWDVQVLVLSDPTRSREISVTVWVDGLRLAVAERLTDMIAGQSTPKLTEIRRSIRTLNRESAS